METECEIFPQTAPFSSIDVDWWDPDQFYTFRGKRHRQSNARRLEAKEQSLVLAGHIQHCFLLHPRGLVLQLLKLLVSTHVAVLATDWRSVNERCQICKQNWLTLFLSSVYAISNLGKNIFCRYTSSPIQLYFATIKFYCHFPKNVCERFHLPL